MTKDAAKNPAPKAGRAPHGLGPVGTGLYEKLVTAFQPDHIDLSDESHKHIGHAGHRPDGESHFHLELVSAAFHGKSRVERQRLVYTLLADELKERVHALSLRLSSPEEYKKPNSKT